MGLFGTATQLGVSVGSSSIKIAELKKAGKSISLQHFGLVHLPDGALENREVVNHMAAVDALRGLVSEMHIKGKKVITAISGNSVIVKKILVEALQPKELEHTISWEAEQYVPFDIKDATFDFQVINKNGPEGKMEVMLVACRKSTVEMFSTVLKDAGLTTKCVDVDLFALQNIFEANYPSDTPVALVDIGGNGLKLVICNNGQSVFFRDVSYGGKNLTQEIQSHLKLSFAEAESLKIDPNQKGQLPQEVTELMQVSADSIAAEIHKSLDFFNASNSGIQVQYILLTGGCSKLPRLTEIIEEKTSLPTQLLNPFNRIQYDPKIFTEEYIEKNSSLMAIPMGLALRGLE